MTRILLYSDEPILAKGLESVLCQIEGFELLPTCGTVSCLLEQMTHGRENTGTLDPLATGLLPLCFGDATKFAQALLDARKEYVATVLFGVATTTGEVWRVTPAGVPTRMKSSPVVPLLSPSKLPPLTFAANTVSV